jgi:hypothetical protein
LRHRTFRRNTALAFVASLCIAEVRADYGMATDLDAKTYTSASGTYTLLVEPSTRAGAGPADYTLKRRDEIVWQGRRPLTLWDAVVAEDGTVGGYGYSTGFNGAFRVEGHFFVARLDADGSFSELERTPRQESLALHDMANPKASGILIDEDDDRFVVRVSGSAQDTIGETWWSFRLSDGDAVGRTMPPAPSAALEGTFVVDAFALPGLPLTLVQWLVVSLGPRFTLLDLGNRTVWESESMAVGEDLQTSRILPPSAPKRIAISDVHKKQRVEFSVSGDALEWRVEEVARADLVPPPDEQDFLPIDGVPQRELRLLGTVRFGGAGGEPNDAIADFIIDPLGRIGTLSPLDCGGKRKSPTLRILATDGAIAREVALPPTPCEGRSPVIAPGARGWLIAQPRQDNRSALFRLDPSSGELASISEFDGSDIEAMAETADGFVALVTEHSKYSMETTLRGYDADGRQRWRVEEGLTSEASVFSAEDVTVTSNGTVVVLENIPHKLKLFDSQGRYLGAVALDQAWGRRPNYPSGIEADNADGVIVYDFEGKSTAVHMSLDGHVQAEFTPAFEDGRRMDVVGNVQGVHDGTYWTSDGYALLRLDAKGLVTSIIGKAPSTDALGKASGIAITRDGWIYAVDERTGAVHVYDEGGRAARVCRPAAADLERDSAGNVTVSSTGDIFVQHGSAGAAQGYLHFDADCRRIGKKKAAVDEVSQTWLDQPRSFHRWILGYENVYLAEDVRVLRKIERTSSGNWLQSPEPAGVAADGALAVASNAGGFVSGLPRLMATYSPTGEPRHTWRLPDQFVSWQPNLAFDGAHMVMELATENPSTPDELLVVTEAGAPLFRFKPGAGRSPHYIAMVDGEEGQELWAFDGETTIDRYSFEINDE